MKTLEVKFKRLHKDAVIPKRATDLSGGWDITATEIKYLENGLVLVKMGFALAIPEDYKMTIVPRSSFTKYNWVLQNSPTLMDADYRGEYMLKFRAIPTDITDVNEDYVLSYSFPYVEGDRVGQMYLEKVHPMVFTEVEELVDTERGEGGFGSTGI